MSKQEKKTIGWAGINKKYIILLSLSSSSASSSAAKVLRNSEKAPSLLTSSEYVPSYKKSDSIISSLLHRKLQKSASMHAMNNEG